MHILPAFIFFHGLFLGTCGAFPAGAVELTCVPGSYVNNQACSPCPANHFCRGAQTAPVLCPPNAFDSRPTNSSNIDDCACKAGFFRTDNADLLALSLAQNGVTLQESRKIWCVLCPVGYLCNPPSNSSSSKTRVDTCPALSTTRVAGSSVASDCICRAGAYLIANGTNISTGQSLALCAACTKNHYCTGQAMPPSPCPRETVSSSAASSLAGCACLPPLVMLPTHSADFLYDCVVQSSAAFADSGVLVGMQQEKYDLFGMEATELYNMHAVAPLVPCIQIETGSVLLRNLFSPTCSNVSVSQFASCDTHIVTRVHAVSRICTSLQTRHTCGNPGRFR